MYVIIALGLSLVFGVMRLINLAHGDLVILGSYLSYQIWTSLGLDPILSLVITIPVLFGLGFFIQQYLLRRAFAISAEAPLIIAFGISLIIQNFNQIIWTPLSRGISTSYSMSSFSLGARQFPISYLLDFIVALVVMLAFREFLSRTYLGRGITAASQNRRAAQLMGVNTKMIYGFAFAIAMISAAIAGVFSGDDLSVYPCFRHSISDYCVWCSHNRRIRKHIRYIPGRSDTRSGADVFQLLFWLRHPDAFCLCCRYYCISR